MPFIAPLGVVTGTPLEAACLGVLAGLIATCGLSVLIRVTPGMRDLTIKTPPEPKSKRFGPDPFDREAVRAWQDDMRSPAVRRAPERAAEAAARLRTTPEAALVTEHGPGPEGAAERFAAKVAAGLFNRDLLDHEKLAGKIVHFGYGSVWGGVYGVLQASLAWPWVLSGTLYGALVWLVGPAALVPAMKVMLSPRELGFWKSTLVLTGHVIYGLLVALMFMVLCSGWLT